MERPILQRGRGPWVADHHRGALYGRLSTGVFELLVHIAGPQSPKSTRLTLEVDVLSVVICPSGLPVTPIVATRWESTWGICWENGNRTGFCWGAAAGPHARQLRPDVTGPFRIRASRQRGPEAGSLFLDPCIPRAGRMICLPGDH